MLNEETTRGGEPGTSITPNPPVMSAVMMPWFLGSHWVPKFSGEKGTVRFSQWLAQVEAFLRAQTLQPPQGVDFILSSLDGPAHREAMLLPSTTRGSAQEMLEVLARKYGDNRSPDTLQVEFFSCRQTEKEGIEEFTLRLRECLYRWRTGDPDQAGNEDKRLRAQFAKGLREGPIRHELLRHLRRNPLMPFKDVCQEASSIEREERATVGEVATCQAHAAAVAPAPKTELLSQSSLQQLKDSLRAELREELHEQVVLLRKTIAEELRSQLQAPERDSEPAQRSARPPTGPLAGVPTYRRPDRQEARGYQWDDQGRPICRSCGEAGHVQRYCPRRPGPPPDFHASRSLQGK